MHGDREGVLVKLENDIIKYCVECGADCSDIPNCPVHFKKASSSREKIIPKSVKLLLVRQGIKFNKANENDMLSSLIKEIIDFLDYSSSMAGKH